VLSAAAYRLRIYRLQFALSAGRLIESSASRPDRVKIECRPRLVAYVTRASQPERPPRLLGPSSSSEGRVTRSVRSVWCWVGGRAERLDGLLGELFSPVERIRRAPLQPAKLISEGRHLVLRRRPEDGGDNNSTTTPVPPATRSVTACDRVVAPTYWISAGQPPPPSRPARMTYVERCTALALAQAPAGCGPI
jgi:hypothetical protein